MRKQSSTNTMNKVQLEADCGMAYTMSMIGGRWKLSILYNLLGLGILRFGELKSKIPNITERMLIKQLRELEKDGLVQRKVYAEVPPKVEYGLSDKGKSLEGILNGLSSWGDEHRGLPLH
ncbi:winged helix-turn-helix transcriptional regulator [Flagellimonas baculiformis]|uniref:winged helix-turn-helix transcriptional regulator n=1 Tax=Flagellimonas baculiformis TaxID=3067310 RepID=UPI00296ED3EF|nr:helix-turn-helix domain-containing protein [Muricauda sp. D6]